MSALTSRGAGRPGISAVVMTMSCLAMCDGDQRRLLGLVGVRHFLGVAARGLGLLELLVLDGDEFGAERFDLLLGGGAHVGRGDDGAEPPRGGDRLQAGDADAHDEGPGGGHRAGRRHHHRQARGRIRRPRRSRRDSRRDWPGRTARPSTCARVMRGISSIAKAATPALRQRLDLGLMAVGVHGSRRPARRASARAISSAFGPAHLQHDVGAERLGLRRPARAPAAGNRRRSRRRRGPRRLRRRLRRRGR